MGYPDAAWERAMKVQDVILRALSGEIHWFRAAEIIGISPRTLRRLRRRYELGGYDGLIDKRRRRPSQRRVAMAEVEGVVRIYRERYRGFGFHGGPTTKRRKCCVRSSVCDYPNSSMPGKRVQPRLGLDEFVQPHFVRGSRGLTSTGTSARPRSARPSPPC
jgi:hypothetical protein